jgi:hypothetical protein
VEGEKTGDGISYASHVKNPYPTEHLSLRNENSLSLNWRLTSALPRVVVAVLTLTAANLNGPFNGSLFD